MSDLAPEASDVTPEVAPETPAWAMTEEQYNELAGAVGYLAQLEQQRAAVYQPEQAQQQQDFDPYDRDSLRGIIREEIAPLQQFTAQATLAEAEERAMDILQDLSVKDGEFDVDLARTRADRLLPAMQQRYGYGPKAAEAALEQAAADQRAYEQKLYQDAVARHTNHLATLSGAPGEPGSTYTVGVQQRTMPDYRQGGSVTSRFFGPKAEA